MSGFGGSGGSGGGGGLGGSGVGTTGAGGSGTGGLGLVATGDGLSLQVTVTMAVSSVSSALLIAGTRQEQWPAP